MLVNGERHGVDCSNRNSKCSTPQTTVHLDRMKYLGLKASTHSRDLCLCVLSWVMSIIDTIGDAVLSGIDIVNVLDGC